MTLREQKKRDTTAALAEATVQLSLDQGFDTVTVDQIAEAAGVSRRTFFRYFDTKEAAFFGPHEARMARFEAALTDRRPGERRYAAVRRCLITLGEEYDANRDEIVARHRTIQASRALLAHELGLDRRYEAAIAEALTDPEAGPAEAVRARVLAAAVFGVVRAVLRHWFETEDLSLAELGAQALDLLEDGFRYDRGVVLPLPRLEP